MPAELPDPVAALLGLLRAEGPLSVARACKRLGLPASRLRRMLAALVDDAVPERGHVQVATLADGREQLVLTARGAEASDWFGTPALAAADTLRLGPDGQHPRLDWLAEEVPVALVFNGHAHAVMLGTPSDLEDFAVGFALSERIVAAPGDLRIAEIATGGSGISIECLIPEREYLALRERHRHLAGNSACGVCGQEALTTLVPTLPEVAGAVPVELDQVQAAMAELRSAQRLNRACGALHGAGIGAAADLLVREDIGRHNAVDKAIGAAARAGRRPDLLVVTSRASYEILAKAALAGIGTVAAISAPSALAVRIARRTGIRLYGFTRGEAATVYA